MIDREYSELQLNPLSANATKWSYTIKQFAGKLPLNCLSVFDHFVGLVLKGLRKVLYFGKLGLYIGNLKKYTLKMFIFRSLAKKIKKMFFQKTLKTILGRSSWGRSLDINAIFLIDLSSSHKDKRQEELRFTVLIS